MHRISSIRNHSIQKQILTSICSCVPGKNLFRSTPTAGLWNGQFSRRTTAISYIPKSVVRCSALSSGFPTAHLDAGTVTTPTTLNGEQEVFYITGGKGTVTAGGKTHELRKGIIFLVPAELEFSIQNTGDEIMTMYLIVEPIPDGFRPNDEILVKDENSMAYRDQGFLTVHWSHNGLNVFTVKDGLGTLESVNILTFNAMTIGQPHSHDESTEEVWTLVEGKNLAFLGKEIRWQVPGTAYKIPPNGQTPHSNINTTERPAKFLYFSRFREHEVRK